MLKPTQKAPDFTLPDHTGQAVSLADLIKDGPLILYFYPADFTPGCTKEACNIRDMHQELVQAGLRVFGISPQDAASHTKFKEKYNLPFTLLSDVNKAVIRQFDVEGPFGLGVRRATFLIDADGEIKDAVMADFRISEHDQFMKKVVALQSKR